MSISGEINIKKLHEMLIAMGFHGSINVDVPLKNLTYYKIGGPAALIADAEDISDITLVKKLANEHSVSLLVMGAGSNLLISDKGFGGLVLRMGKSFSTIDVNPETMIINCGASAQLGHVLREGAKIGFEKIECLAGIPGWVGGALFMNAGSFDVYISDIVESVDVVKSDGEMISLTNDKCDFGYRSSRFQNSKDIILGCVLKGRRGDVKAISSEVERRMEYRRNTQPIDLPSCGCVFRNPFGEKSAAQLIDEAGLKGTRSGNAEISTIHANFIVNRGNASSDDVLNLMALIRYRIREMFGITLIPEVETAGFSESIGVMLDERERKIH